MSEGAESLLRRVPPVLRARDFRLYTQGGKRLVDLWQCNGRAVLGHTPPKVLGQLKNTAERGLFTGFPHPLEKRFTQALSRLFPDRLFRVYAEEAPRLRALGYGEPMDPAMHTAEIREFSLWRPFLEDHEPFSLGSALLIPVLPWALAPKVVVIPPSLEADFPPSDLLSPVILAAGTRSIYNLIAEGSVRGKLRFPKIEETLKRSPWRRRGIYLRYGEPLDQASYTRLFMTFLEEGFLLPPEGDLPLILPGILSPGEEAKLAKLLGDSDAP